MLKSTSKEIHRCPRRIVIPTKRCCSVNTKFGGSGEIRTHERVAPSPVFKTGAFNRSATLPYSNCRRESRFDHPWLFVVLFRHKTTFLSRHLNPHSTPPFTPSPSKFARPVLSDARPISRRQTCNTPFVSRASAYLIEIGTVGRVIGRTPGQCVKCRMRRINIRKLTGNSEATYGLESHTTQTRLRAGSHHR